MRIISRLTLCLALLLPLCAHAQSFAKMTPAQLQSARDSLYVLRNYTMSQEYAKYAEDNSQLIVFTFLSSKTINEYYKKSPELQKAKLVYESVAEDLHAALMKDAAYNAKYNSRQKKRSFVETEDEFNQDVKALAKRDPDVDRLWKGKRQLKIIYHCTVIRVISADYLKNKLLFSVDWMSEEGLSYVNAKRSVRYLNRKLLLVEQKLAKSN